MRRLLVCLLPMLLFACSSSNPERAAHGTAEEVRNAKNTDTCLDHPEMAAKWGECNVKSTLFNSSDAFAKCRKAGGKATGSVNFELSVRGDGTVKSAHAQANDQNPRLISCVRRAMKRLKFAPTPEGKDAKITVPYQL